VISAGQPGYRRPALELVLNRLPATIELALLAFIVSKMPLAHDIGVVLCNKARLVFDYLGKTLATVTVRQMPESGSAYGRY